MFGLERTAAFETDSLASTRSVEYEVRSPQDCEGMFDVLTYQKGGALLRMLEQYLGAERFREGVSHYLAPARLRQHRDQRPVGRHRGTTSGRAGAADDGLLDLAGRVPARRPRRSTGGELVLRQERFAFDGDTSRPTPRRPRGSCRCTCAPAASRTPCCSTATRRALPLADPAAPVVVNAGGHGFFRVAYSDELRGRISGEVLGDARHARALQPRRRRVERGRRRPPAGRRVPGVRRGLRRRARARRVAGDRRSACAASAGCSTTTPTRAFQARVARPARARRRRARRPRRRRGRPARQAPRPARRRASPCRATTRRRGPGRRAWYDQAEATPGSVDPELVAAATSVVAATGDEPSTSGCSPATARAPTPQEQLRHLYALGRVRRRGARCCARASWR